MPAKPPPASVTLGMADGVDARVPHPHPTADSTARYLEASRQTLYARTDRLLAALMAFQWLAGVLVAAWLAPSIWASAQAGRHVHLLVAIFIGGAITTLPVALAFLRPGRRVTRHTIAVAQMLYGAMLIHLTGGRIETHFHLFGSLAFLACYRDWRVLVSASAVVAADILLRGTFYPLSIFGVATVSPWRWGEHVMWVVFIDVFLIWSCMEATREMREVAATRAELEQKNREQDSQLSSVGQNLRASEERQRLILDTALDAVVTMNDRGVITSWNRQAEEIFGWRSDEAIGRRMSETIIPPDLREAHERGLAHFMKSGEGPVLGKRIEVPALHRSGETFPCELSIVPLRFGETMGFSGFVRNISHRKQAEAALRDARDAAEAANRAKSEFLANMSHEIRTPLNGVTGMIDVVRGGDIDDAQRRHLDIAKASANTLLHLINDILDLSKIEAGQLELDHVMFRISDVVEEVATLLSPQAREKGLTLEWDTAPEVRPYLVGDPHRLRQVLTNLVANAVKFTQRGRVSVELEVAAEDEEAQTLRVTVRDTGIGIPADRLDRLFRSFSQVDASTSRRFGGSGLGLAISRQLCRMMGGDIEVSSAVGVGSAFTFTLRCEKAAVTEAIPTVGEAGRWTAPPATSAETPGTCTLGSDAPPRVLIAEDNPVNQIVVSELVKRAGLACDLVDNGRKAVDAVIAAEESRGQPVALILMDCQMPEMDGYEATRRIRSLEAEAKLTHPPRIVALTANAMKGDRERCLDAGMDDYLSKPVDETRLIEALHRWLGVGGTMPASHPVGMGGATYADEPINTDGLLARCMGMADLACELLDVFEAECRKDLEALTHAVESGDLPRVRSLAHKLKGAAAQVAADSLRSLAEQLEHTARENSPTSPTSPTQELHTRLTAEAHRCFAASPELIERLTIVDRVSG